MYCHADSFRGLCRLPGSRPKAFYILKGYGSRGISVPMPIPLDRMCARLRGIKKGLLNGSLNSTQSWPDFTGSPMV